MAYTIKIDLKSQTPVYKQLINSVETAIHNGEYRYGDLLPSMNELSLQLGISKETVKKAYSLMRDRGVISATQGKGFYVSSENSGQNPKILVLFDKLSTYKQVLFSSFSSTIGTQGEITIRLHNQQIDLLEYYIDENLDQFDYYVVTPHFPLDESTQRRAVKALMRICLLFSYGVLHWVINGVYCQPGPPDGETDILHVLRYQLPLFRLRSFPLTRDIIASALPFMS